MRKRAITPIPQSGSPSEERWLDLESAASVEVTSEEKDHPIESALVSKEKRGWRAAKPGAETIRLIFDEPQKLGCIWVVFEESEIERSQEFVLRWSPNSGHSFREIEVSAKKKFMAELVEMAIERAQDYGLPSDSIQLRPPRSAGMVVEKTS